MCSVRAASGIDEAGLWREWTRQKRASLKDFAAVGSFDELCRSGCHAFPLAIAFAIFQPLQSIASKWQLITGPPRRREQRIRVLEKSAAALEELQTAFVDAMMENPDRSIPSEILTDLRKELINPSDLDTIWSKKAPAPHPATTIHALRFYASSLRKFDRISDETGISSSDMLPKYIISAYVQRATGGFHDAEVSTLIGAVLRSVYDETAHRMWRSRNYERIDADFAFLPKLLIGIGVVTSSQM